ncbi:MAG: FG-GAP-like repeat-containing protein, partial [bacterium]
HGQFKSISSNAVGGGAVAWGDSDNDGDLDLLLSGGLHKPKLYRNDGKEQFVDLNLKIPEYGAPVVWGDYDNDGDLDFMTTGTDTAVKIEERIYYLRIYRNDGIKANTKPAPLTNLTTVVSRDSVVFRWTKSQDYETPTSGLSYNLSVGTSPASSNIVSPMANLSTGHRLVANVGNAGQSAMWKIKNLSGGKYYWSVQAIDHAFAGSEFAPTQSFVVPPAPPQLLSPENASTWVPVSTTLVWNKSAGTDDYRVQVSSMQNFSTFIYNKSVGVDTSVKIEVLEKGTIYYWRVRAANAGGTSESLVSHFTTVLAVPELLLPADSAVGIPTEVTCRWRAVKGAEFYVLHVARDKSFQMGLQNYSGIIDTAFKIFGLAPNVAYYWRVAAGHAGKLSDWSQVRF